MEVQLPKGNDAAGNPQIESYGWTQLDLFSMKKELKRGKFKCPLYEVPTAPGIRVEDIKFLEMIPTSWIYLRVSYPQDDLIAE